MRRLKWGATMLWQLLLDPFGRGALCLVLGGVIVAAGQLGIERALFYTGTILMAYGLFRMWWEVFKKEPRSEDRGR